MAALGMYDFREPNIQDYIKFEKQLLTIQKIVKSRLKIVFMECTMPCGATMIAADAGRTAEFDGTGTPIIIYVISSNVGDNGTTPGLGVRSVKVFGTDENDELIEDTILTNGTTQVAGTVKFKRLIGAKAVTAGATATAIGAITITSAAQAATYLTIPAGQIATAQAGKMYIPEGWYGSILEFNASFVQSANATALDLANGANVWIQYLDGLLIPDELNIFSVVPTSFPPVNPPWQFYVGGDDSLIDVFHQAIDTDVTTNPVHYQITYVLYKE